MISEYKILDGDTPDRLSQWVVKYLDQGDGWEVYGQPFVAQINNIVIFCQAMIRSGAYKHEILEMIG